MSTLLTAPLWAVLAHFEQCSFEQLRISPRAIHSRATLAFDDCRFTSMLTDPSVLFGRREGLVLTNTSMELYDWTRGPLPSRSLGDLFPGWRRIAGR